jgi:micrococcal nuclease
MHDGDTIVILVGKEQVKIRLDGIDAPEANQAFGSKSREALASKIFGKVVNVEWKEQDRYGRTLGKVIINGRWVNKEMIAEGWAWHYKQYNKERELTDAENNAREKKLGLWHDKDPTPPWEFRKKDKPKAKK